MKTAWQVKELEMMKSIVENLKFTAESLYDKGVIALYRLNEDFIAVGDVEGRHIFTFTDGGPWRWAFWTGR